MTIIILSIIGASLVGAFSARFLLRGNHISLGFAGGAILGLVFLEIIPELFEEALSLNVEAHILSIAVLLGFLVMHVLEKASGLHEHAHSDGHIHTGKTMAVGTLSLHAFIDGLGLGAAYFVSNSLGIAVLAAFVLHKFLDGMNIQAIAQASVSKNRRFFLVINIGMTLLAVFLVSLFWLSASFLLFLAALVAGVLLYVSSVHVLPEAHEHENSWKTILATVCGVVIVFLLSQFHV